MEYNEEDVANVSELATQAHKIAVQAGGGDALAAAVYQDLRAAHIFNKQQRVSNEMQAKVKEAGLGQNAMGMGMNPPGYYGQKL